MNDRSLIQTPEPGPQGGWVDAYMPDGQAAAFRPQQMSFNLAMVRGILFRQRWLIAAVIAAAIVGGIVISLLATPMYRAESKVRITPYGSFILQGQDVEQQVASNQVFTYIATQIEVIKSRSIAETIASELNLGARYDLLGKDVDQGRPAKTSDQEWLKAKEQMAASILAGSVSVEVPQDNWVLRIGFTSANPELAAEMANAYADAFAKSDIRRTTRNNEYALEYLSARIKDVRERLAAAETASNAYARQTGIVVQQIDDGSEGGGTSTLTAVNLADINTRVAAARANRIEAEQRWRSVQNLPSSQLSEVQSSPRLQVIVNERNLKSVQLTELRQRYNDDFPQIATLLAQIKALDAQIERDSADVKASLRSAFIVAQNQERALEAELASIAGTRLAEQEKQIEYGVLEREAGALRDQLKALLDRYNEVNSASQADAGTISKLDAAAVPSSPYSPNYMRNLGLALLLGVALAAGLAVVAETLDDRVRTLEDVESKLGMTLLGHTPEVDDRTLADGTSDKFSALMEAYSSIRAAVDFSLPRNRNVLQLTSSQPGEGKSTTAVILAELFASLGRKVLLIDADLRRPSVSKLLDIERPKIGVVEVLLGHTAIADAVVKGGNDNLDILPVGEIPPNPTELLASAEFIELIERVKKEYSLVIIDCSPVLGMADAPLVARVADATVFVMEANKVPFGQARSAIKRLMQGGGKVAGVVLTKYSALEAGQYYAYQYGYYQYGRETK